MENITPGRRLAIKARFNGRYFRDLTHESRRCTHHPRFPRRTPYRIIPAAAANIIEPALAEFRRQPLAFFVTNEIYGAVTGDDPIE